MTPELLERDWLSLRYWALWCALPSALILIGLLIAFKLILGAGKDLNHYSVIVGFFTLYFVLIRGGHLFMVRGLHKELLRKYQDGYRHKLGYITRAQIKRHNIGFTLARIKRELMTEALEKKSKPLG